MSDLIKLTGLVNRREFPDGEWDGEPDLAIWREPETEYLCAVSRVRIGTLCGYVGVPKGYPAHGERELFADVYNDVEVHWGVTFASETPFTAYGCPIVDLVALVEDGVPDFWVGFDCAHSGDLQPLLFQEFPMPGEQYRTFSYARNEVVRMARDLWEIAQ